MKNKIHFDQSAYNDFLRGFTAPAKSLQKVVDAFNGLQIGNLDTGEFRKIFTDEVESVFFDKITEGQDLVLNGIKLDKKKALEIIQKPDGYQHFLDTLQEIKTQLGLGAINNYTSFSQYRVIENYIINNAGNVEADPLFLEMTKNTRFTYYATNEQQQAYHNALVDFIAVMKSFVDKGLYFHKMEVFEHIDEFVHYNTTDKDFKIQYDRLASFFNKHTIFNKQ